MGSTINPIRKLANDLGEYQQWRRGEGKYAFSENPEENLPMPFTPSELTAIMNATINILYAVADGREVNPEEVFA